MIVRKFIFRSINCQQTQNAAAAAFCYCEKLFLVLVFALLVSNAARSFASGLARSLALAATAVVNSLYDILGLDGLDSVHRFFLLNI